VLVLEQLDELELVLVELNVEFVVAHFDEGC